VDRAANLYESFTGHDATSVKKLDIKFDDTWLSVGKCDGILYSTRRDGVNEKYIHKFKTAARPEFWVSHDGAQLALVGGNFRFTEAGITDN
jgi:hypothetical protein